MFNSESAIVVCDDVAANVMYFIKSPPSELPCEPFQSLFLMLLKRLLLPEIFLIKLIVKLLV
jgi:hypothetical protein